MNSPSNNKRRVSLFAKFEKQQNPVITWAPYSVKTLHNNHKNITCSRFVVSDDESTQSDTDSGKSSPIAPAFQF